MFKSYQHVERITSDACEGILENDNCVITAKIDGTNACVWLDTSENPDWAYLCTGSRKREINPNDDNAGFAEWVQESDDDEVCCLRELCHDHPDWIIYGEWLGAFKFIGNIKDYNQEAKRAFWIFDVYDRERGCYLPDDEWRPVLAEGGLEQWFVKILATLDHPTYDDLLEIAKNNKFLLDNANHAGEGIVVKVPGWRNKYGHQVYGKLVLDEYAQEKKKNKSVRLPGDTEREIVDTYMTNAELSKTYAKIALACSVDTLDIKNGKHVGMFVSTVYRDLLEECPNWCKKMKNPVVDFAALKGLAQTKARKYIGL